MSRFFGGFSIRTMWFAELAYVLRARGLIGKYDGAAGTVDRPWWWLLFLGVYWPAKHWYDRISVWRCPHCGCFCRPTLDDTDRWVRCNDC